MQAGWWWPDRSSRVEHQRSVGPAHAVKPPRVVGTRRTP